MLKTGEKIMKIETHDMHTGGEPVRIVVSGMPELKGSTILEKRDYARTHLDDFRKLIMNEPRGHKDMYGAIINQVDPFDKDIGAIFFHNEGYSSMCGHAVIALGRYVLDRGLVRPTSPETEIVFHCPCGPVKTVVQYNNGFSGRVSFRSVPAFVYKLGIDVKVPSIGVTKIDIAFGGAFYAIVEDKALGLDIKATPLSEIVKCASSITEYVKKQVPIVHPFEKDLSFLYGTIITDGNDNYEDGPSTNICVFADKEVDRSATGSGVTARIALQFKKRKMTLNQSKEFRSLIGTAFSGKAVEETIFSEYKSVIVEVSGMAYHTGSHTFYLEKGDPLGTGFQLDR
ncbi:trans-L-3-hydroxyproline dehydratase [Parasteatoda tepidariorum]|uniref:trans-L-3-hydroxyproline dehydratase n=1 Tax=Parasteatoda tepidariorum TaxID=114398 RepID=UPI00077F97AB|nr:trans-L-3-hydroxyproline dehydratase [Parasteatoda tepidariorum]